MKLDEYIDHLKRLRHKNGGDLEVCTTRMYRDGRTLAPVPTISYTMKLEGNAKHDKFWEPGLNADRLKGEMVVRV